MRRSLSLSLSFLSLSLLFSFLKPTLFFCLLGAVVNAFTILTAAHCFDEYKRHNLGNYRVVVGTVDRTVVVSHLEFTINRPLIPDEYNPDTRNWADIAFIKLVKKIPLGIDPSVASILPAVNGDEFDENSCILPGWGRDTEKGIPRSHLQFLHVEIAKRDNQICFPPFDGPPHKATLCVLNKFSLCNGDSGSPLICPLKYLPSIWKVVGVASSGECDVPLAATKLSTFTDVRFWTNWILLRIALLPDFNLFDQPSRRSSHFQPPMHDLPYCPRWQCEALKKTA